MLKKMRGFTLIELLIVVAIIGILAALLIPNAMAAMQKAKQKGTIKDINTISTALMDYVTDRGEAPTAFGAQLTGSTDTVVAALEGFYLKVFPIRDQWNHGFWIYTQASCANNAYTITLASNEDWGTDDFIVGSSGRNTDNNDEPFDISNPSASLYEVRSMNDFNKEIVNWNGSMVIGPRVGAGTGT